MPIRLKRIFYKMPGYLQYPASFLYLDCFLPIKSGPVKYLKIYNFLKKSQWWPRWKLEQYQTERLRHLLKHAYKNVPYYTDIFKKLNLTPEDIKSIEDLKKLPILTKEDIIKHFDKLISLEVNKKRITLVSTSGSTGKPMQFYRDELARPIESLLMRRNLEWANLKISDKHIRLWSRPFIEKSLSNIYLYWPLLRRIILSTVSCEVGRLDEYIKLLRKFNPIYITGNPSMLYHLACYAKEKNINDIKFKCFFSYHENIFPYQKELIEKQFNCKVFNYYGTAERVISAMECPEHAGMHIGMEKGIIEIIGEDGKTLPEGEQGRIIATGFYNYAMPFVRYDVGDIGAISKKPCSCGRGSLVLKSLDGRANEALRYNNKIIYSPTLSIILWQFKNIKECQFVQESEGEIKINIVRRKDYSEKDSKGLIEALQKMINDKLNVNINFVENIPRTKMGKFPFIISKINSDADRKGP